MAPCIILCRHSYEKHMKTALRNSTVPADLTEGNLARIANNGREAK